MTLFLNITQHYLDKIISGEKKIEYRSMTNYYRSRIEGIDIEAIHIRAGYSRSSPEALIMVQKIEKDCYHPLTGKAYGIHLGDIIEICNVKNSGKQLYFHITNALQTEIKQ